MAVRRPASRTVRCGAGRPATARHAKPPLQSRQRGFCTQFVQGTQAAHLSASEQNEAVTNPFRVRQLVNGENKRTPAFGVMAQHTNDVAGLPEIETVERLVHQNQLVRS